MTTTTRIHPGVFVLAMTAFAIGVAEFIVIGIFPAISAVLNVPLAWLVWRGKRPQLNAATA